MRWFAYFILAYVLLGLQLGLGAQIRYRGAAPDFVLFAVIFISLNAPRDEAMLGSFLIGALQDLVTLQPMGLYAFSYGLIAIFVSSLAQVAYREHPLTHFLMTLIGGVITAAIVLIHGYIHPLAPARIEGDTVLRAVRQSPRLLAVSVVYTSLLAPIVLGILQRMGWAFSFEPARRKIR